MNPDDKQVLILLTIWNASKSRKIPPSISDLQKATLLSAGGVHFKVKELIDAGFATRTRLARSLSITDKGILLLRSQGLINENNSS